MTVCCALNANPYLCDANALLSCLTARTEFDAKHVEILETWIDEVSLISSPAQILMFSLINELTISHSYCCYSNVQMDETLPPLRNFILPGGGIAAAQLHIAR
jgi:cob(I)alamin adenosyltransferase